MTRIATSSLLDGLRGEVDRTAELVGAAFADLDGTALNWSVEPDRWSVGRCLDHLLVTNRLYLDRIRPCLETARAKGLVDTGVYRQGLFGEWFRRQMEPGKGRLNAPNVFKPAETDVPTSVVRDFLAQQDELRDVIEGARGLDLARVRLPSPVTRMIRFRVGDALGIVVTHQRRHVTQAEKVLASPGFPGP